MDDVSTSPSEAELPDRPGAGSSSRSAAAAARLLNLAPVADDLATRFAAAGHELALVGGSVRDGLLDRLGEDLDFTTDARPQQVLKLVKGWAEAVWEVGIAFGTVGCQKDGYKLEITTYRSEAYDRTSRKPTVSYGETLADDLERFPAEVADRFAE